MTGFLCVFAKIIFPERGDGAWEGRFAYTLAILIIFCWVLFLSKYMVNNIFGFIALGLLSLVVWGAVIDYASMRFFQFFFPFFGAAIVYFHKHPNILLASFSLMAGFSTISHLTWLLGS